MNDLQRALYVTLWDWIDARPGLTDLQWAIVLQVQVTLLLHRGP